jgi:hypothetical protein
MSTAVIGATGRVGSEIVRGLLERGDEVAALVRDPRPGPPGLWRTRRAAYLCYPPVGAQPTPFSIILSIIRNISADFRTGTSALGSGEFEVELASAPPGDGGVGGQVGVAEDG